MRPIAPLVAVPAVALLSFVLGCDDGRLAVTRETVAVGTLPEAPTTAPSTPGASAPSTTTAAPSTTATASTPSTSGDGPAPTTTEVPTAPSRTRFVEELDALVEDEAPARLPTTTLRDDTGRLRLAVPSGWRDHRTQPSALDEGEETPSLAASPHLTTFLDSYDAPGLTALVVPDDPAEALDAYAFGEDCTAGRDGSYVGDAAAGRYEVWESCGGTSHDIVTVAVRPHDAAATVLLLVQVVEAADLEALDLALGSLVLRPG